MSIAGSRPAPLLTMIVEPSEGLQDAIFSFERTTGVVATISSEGGAKSGQLAAALVGGKKIVVCTIQTFPLPSRRSRTNKRR